MRDRRRWRGAVLGVLLPLATAGPARARPETPAAGAGVFRIDLGGATAEVLRVLLAGAYERLGSERCQSLLSTYSDRTGRTLRERLDELGHSSQSYLGLVVFADGSGRRRCQDPHTLAVTAPGSRVVFVCPRTLQRWYAEDRAYAEATLIHEMLHSLGLGENPPPSREITERVLERCHQPAPPMARRAGGDPRAKP